MDKQKRFKKQELNSDADKGMEQGAMVLKGGIGLLGSIILLVKNKENLKTLGKSAVKLAVKVIKR